MTLGEWGEDVSVDGDLAPGIGRQPRSLQIVGAREILEEQPPALQLELLHRQRGAIQPGTSLQRAAAEGLAELLVGHRHSRSSPRTRSESKTPSDNVLAARRWRS